MYCRLGLGEDVLLPSQIVWQVIELIGISWDFWLGFHVVVASLLLFLGHIATWNIWVSWFVFFLVLWLAVFGTAGSARPVEGARLKCSQRYLIHQPPLTAMEDDVERFMMVYMASYWVWTKDVVKFKIMFIFFSPPHKQAVEDFCIDTFHCDIRFILLN